MAVIFVNLIAMIIDFFADKYINVAIEVSVSVLLALNIIYLLKSAKIQKSAYLFLLIISTALFTQIYINHFASMSVVFILLLPLTTMLFISFKHSLIITFVLFLIMGILLYIEHLNNPLNPLTQNSQALFNLAYTALIIYFFGLLYHLANLKTFDELEESNRQKELLLKEVHHRVKNNLNVIASIIGLQAIGVSKDEKEQLLKSKTRIESIAMVHEMLYRCDDFEHIDFNDYIKKLSTLLTGMYAQDREIEIAIDASEVPLSLDVMIHLGIITNELITNSIKYAFDAKKGLIHITLTCKDDNILFTYEDGGRGYENPSELFNSKSLGIKLIKLSSKQLGGTLKLTSPKGLRYEIEFKNG